MENLIIRKAKDLDLSDLAEIEKEHPDYPAWGINGLRSEMQKNFSVILVLEVEKKIIGFINFWIFPGYMEINSIVISKNFLNHGFGSVLLKEAIKYAIENKCKKIFLEVNEKNSVAINFYKKNGFYETGRRIKYYNGIYDAILMTKEIEIGEKEKK